MIIIQILLSKDIVRATVRLIKWSERVDGGSEVIGKGGLGGLPFYIGNYFIAAIPLVQAYGFLF